MGGQRRQIPGDVGRRLPTISAASWHFKLRQATSSDGKIVSYKRGVTGSNSVAPTIRSLFGPVTYGFLRTKSWQRSTADSSKCRVSPFITSDARRLTSVN